MFNSPVKRYREYRSESQIKKKLQMIKPPAGTRLVQIRASHQAGWPMAEGIYATDLDCDKLRTYYKSEFSKQGFTFKLEGKKPGSGTDFIFFTTADYDAGLSCFEPNHNPQEYMIILNWTSSRD
jgi:hypothetical protein